MEYRLTFDETLEVIEYYDIAIDESTEMGRIFIEKYRDKLDAAANGDGDIANEMWNLALREGFVDSFQDRDILDSHDAAYGVDIYE